MGGLRAEICLEVNLSMTRLIHFILIGVFVLSIGACLLPIDLVDLGVKNDRPVNVKIYATYNTGRRVDFYIPANGKLLLSGFWNEQLRSIQVVSNKRIIKFEIAPQYLRRMFWLHIAAAGCWYSDRGP